VKSVHAVSGTARKATSVDDVAADVELFLANLSTMAMTQGNDENTHHLWSIL
jgi:hypothetical protein